jgi:hypothetical protein
MSIFHRTVANVMRHYGCSADEAQRYVDLREEGYSVHQAALMAGLSDPPDPEADAAPKPRFCEDSSDCTYCEGWCPNPPACRAEKERRG